MLTRLRARNARAGDEGLTLMELVVAMSLTVIVGVMTVSFFVVSFRSSNQTADAGLSTAGVRVAMDSWTGMLRVADSPTTPGLATDRFSTTTPNDTVFWANLGNRAACQYPCGRSGLQQIELSVVTDPQNASCFAMQEKLGTGSAVTTRYLANGIAEQAVFSYRTAAGVPTVTPASVAFVTMTVVAGCGAATTQTYTSTVAITGQTT